MSQSWSRSEVARRIDHTLLTPEATSHDVERLCAEAGSLGVLAVCVSPSMLPLAAGVLAPGVLLATVVGFPSGAVRAPIKAAEAALAVESGADEVDMVINLGLAAAGDWAGVATEIRAVREQVPAPKVLKVICESAVLDDAALVEACRAAQLAGADFVKTSTGFHKAGGHSVHAVEVMAGAVGGQLGIKASGGIRTTEQALEVLAAGATRIGASASATILDGLPE